MENRIDKYLDLILTSGVNIKKDQSLVIRAEVESAKYARTLMEKAYDKGAKKVVIYWLDSPSSRLTYLKADDSIFDEAEPWHKALLVTMANEGAAFISLASSDPEILKGVDANRIVRTTKCLNESLIEYRTKIMSNEVRWCVAAVSSPEWAVKVFPNESSTAAAEEKLWDEILKSSRVNKDSNVSAVKAWGDHAASLLNRAKILNNYNLKSIHLKNNVGTDLVIELPDGHIWAGGEEEDTKGIPFCANIPTEELFSAPKRTGVNGVVTSSKPLVYNGNLIDKFKVWFENGRAVKVEAEKNQELLEKMLAIDENAAYLGEIALVPYNSPISLSNVLFYNTLFDENASCHLAFGKAYPHSVKGAIGKSPEELIKMGINDSAIHQDFMIGSSDLTVTGTTFDGKVVDIIKNGDFVF